MSDVTENETPKEVTEAHNTSIKKRGRGRPKGFKMSEESKLRISETKKNKS